MGVRPGAGIGALLGLFFEHQGLGAVVEDLFVPTTQDGNTVVVFTAVGWVGETAGLLTLWGSIAVNARLHLEVEDHVTDALLEDGSGLGGEAVGELLFVVRVLNVSVGLFAAALS